MGRARRPHLPGAVFHLTARTLEKEHLFTPEVRSGTLTDLGKVAPASECRVLAVALMSNHLHLVVQQGGRRLDALMQPLLRRVALRTQRARGRPGPVFWRHYAAVACLDPWHARNAIVYVHLNPVRAGMVDDPAEYPWTSHALYALAPRDRGGPEIRRLGDVVDPTLGLPLFAGRPGRPSERVRADYRAVVEWRLAMDRAGVDRDPAADETELASRPMAAWEGRSWATALSPLFHAPFRPPHDGLSVGSPAPDMATIARNVLAFEAPGVSLDLMRGPGSGRRRSRLRDIIIRRLHEAGYRNVQIARFLGASPSTVSNAVRRYERAPR